jgi:hypothetical protein
MDLSAAPPLDDFDVAYMRHDRAYALSSHPRHIYEADFRLIEELGQHIDLSHLVSNPRGVLFAHMAAGYFRAYHSLFSEFGADHIPHDHSNDLQTTAASSRRR